MGVVDLSGRLYEPLLAETGRRGRGPNLKRLTTKAPNVDEKPSWRRCREPRRKTTTRLDFFRVDATPETLAAVRKRLNEDVQKERIKAYIVLDARTLETG